MRAVRRAQSADPRPTPPEIRAALCPLPSALCALSCRQKMSYQPRYDPLEPSDFFADHMAARPRIAGTVARGELSTNPFMDTGKIGGADGDGFPMPVTQQVLDRGEERFNIYCAPCHSRTGEGDGMVVLRGYRRRGPDLLLRSAPSLHSRGAPTDKRFGRRTYGFAFHSYSDGGGDDL